MQGGLRELSSRSVLFELIFLKETFLLMENQWLSSQPAQASLESPCWRQGAGGGVLGGVMQTAGALRAEGPIQTPALPPPDEVTMGMGMGWHPQCSHLE